MPGSGDPREQVGVPAGLQAFQDLDGPFDGIADNPGRGHPGGAALAFEGQAGEPAAVDAAVLGAAHAQAAGPQVLDFAVSHPGQVCDGHPCGCLQQPGEVLGRIVGDRAGPRLAAEPPGDLGAQVGGVGDAEFGCRDGEELLAAWCPEGTGGAADLAGQVRAHRPAVQAGQWPAFRPLALDQLVELGGDVAVGGRVATSAVELGVGVQYPPFPERGKDVVG